MFVDALLFLIVVGTNIAKLLRYLSSSHWGSFKNTCFSSARLLDDWLRWHAHVGMGWKPPTSYQFPGPRFSLVSWPLFRAGKKNTHQVDVRRQTMLILDLVSNTQDAIQQSFPAAGKLWKWAKWGAHGLYQNMGCYTTPIYQDLININIYGCPFLWGFKSVPYPQHPTATCFSDTGWY